MIPTYSNTQNLRNVQPTPSISTREFTVLPGTKETLKIVGTSVYVSQCYTVDAEGYQLPAACRITLGHCEPFIAETGTAIEFKYYGTPFNQISIEGLGAEKIFVVLQIGYMLEARKGEAGTAGAIALLREKIEENKDALAEILALVNAIKPATSTTYGLVKYANETIASNDNAPVLRNADGQMRVPVATTGQYGAIKLGTSTIIPNEAGLIGRCSNGGAAVRFATNQLGGAVRLANDLNDTRTASVISAALAKSIIDALNERISTLENTISNLTTGAAMILETGVDASAQSLSVPLAGEKLNGSVSAETNADWLSADSTGKIDVEAL